MKIGFLSVFNYGSNIGGIENHIYFMVNEFVSLGHEVVIFQPVLSDSNKVETVVKDGLKIIKIPIPDSSFLSFFNRFNGAGSFGFLTAFFNKAKYFLYRKKIARIILKYNVDIIHQHDFISNIFTSKLLAKNNVKTVLTNHTGEYLFLSKTYIGRLFLKYCLQHFSFVIGPSGELTPDFVRNKVTIHNGVDPKRFYIVSDMEKEDIRRKYGLKCSDYIVVCPRRWAPTKGVIYLIESIVKYDYPENYKFLFAGSDYDGFPKYKERINDLILSSGKKNIIKLGNLNIEQMNEIYNISDLVVIPSLMEAVSLSAVEAMATGTPVISTDVGGMPELIKSGTNGMLVAPKNSAALHDAIIKFSDLEFYEKIRNSSIVTALDYTWHQKAVETLKVYDKVLGS